MNAPIPTYDYLVVGAGTAGCVLAGRLSEDSQTTVCIFEAGGRDNHPFIHVPSMVGPAIATPRLNWRFQTVPQEHLNQRCIPQPRGRVLGGSGSINGMVYSRGNPLDYDDWARDGATGWDYASVLPYFVRSENNEDYPASTYHGRGGPINVRRPGRPNRLNFAFIHSLEAMGFPPATDFAGPNPEGVGLRQGLIRRGRRVTTAGTYLHPAISRGNVDLKTDARVLKILVADGRAYGLLYECNGIQAEVHARKEIILSAGALQSPQLLLLSGIGPANELQAAGIQPVYELPNVGRNLHDHLACPVLMSSKNSTSYGISARALPRNIANFFEYLIRRSGPLASNVFESVAFLKTAPGLDRPDVQFVFQPAMRPSPKFPLPVGHGHAISPVVLYPKSRGKVTLAGPDPHAAPLIDPALLSAPEDIEPMIRAIKLARRILASDEFKPYEATEIAPGVNIQNDLEIDHFIRSTAYTVHHQVGTCRMGSDAESVVDTSLKLRGVDGVRIADASVIPSVVGGNTNAVAIMIAEKAADLIRNKPLLPAASLSSAN